MTTEFEGKTAQDVRKRMEEIMEQRGEGLVIKHPDSEYVLNGRNKDWIKVRAHARCRVKANTKRVAGQAGVYGNRTLNLRDCKVLRIYLG